MSIYKGTELLAGVATDTVSNAHSLFDFIWSDHIKNEMSWVNANYFSWLDGSLYVSAYNHLVADYSGGTSQTETVGSYTITYVLADDGHKITTDETTVANIYAESGVAWYYIIDTANQRFKLPRENPAREELVNLIQSPVKGNGMTLGWTADGPTAYGTFTASSCVYTRTGSVAGTMLPDSSSGAGGSQITATNAYIGITTDGSKSGLIADLSNATKTSVYKGKKYLYFYVGNFSQTATEQTAGLNASLFNGKADIDLSNAASNASASAKETIVGWGMPDYSTGVSRSWDTSYLADKDTVICYQTNHQSGNDNVEPKVSSDNSNWITLFGQNAGNSNFMVGGWFICPKGWYWKMTGGKNVDRALVSYIVKGEV